METSNDLLPVGSVATPEAATKTSINRGKLLRDVQAGKIEARISYRYDGRNVSSTDWMPARIKADHDDFVWGAMNFTTFDFTCKSGMARQAGDVIKFYCADPNKQFELRYKR